MKKRVIALMVAVLFCALLIAGIAFAENVKGVIKSVDAEKGTVVVTDKKSGKDVAVIVEHKNKLDKFKAGDDVKVRYEIKDGKNVATDFRGVEGC